MKNFLKPFFEPIQLNLLNLEEEINQTHFKKRVKWFTNTKRKNWKIIKNL